jgi:hypothetical protein
MATTGTRRRGRGVIIVEREGVKVPVAVGIVVAGGHVESWKVLLLLVGSLVGGGLVRDQ